MGNYISCSLSVAIIESQSQGPKVILPNNSVLQLGATSSTAAELMLDHPGYFLAHSAAVRTNRRLSALSADEELELGALYAMFPMDRLGSVPGAEDLVRLVSGSGKPVSDSTVQMAPMTEPRAMIDDDLIEEYKYLKNMSRSKRPAMDTIREEVF